MYGHCLHWVNVEEEVGPPRPPERSKSKTSSSMGKLLEGERNPNMELHAVERSRTEQTIITGGLLTHFYLLLSVCVLYL